MLLIGNGPEMLSFLVTRTALYQTCKLTQTPCASLSGPGQLCRQILGNLRNVCVLVWEWD